MLSRPGGSHLCLAPGVRRQAGIGDEHEVLHVGTLTVDIDDLEQEVGLPTPSIDFPSTALRHSSERVKRRGRACSGPLRVRRMPV